MLLGHPYLEFASYVAAFAVGFISPIIFNSNLYANFMPWWAGIAILVWFVSMVLILGVLMVITLGTT